MPPKQQASKKTQEKVKAKIVEVNKNHFNIHLSIQIKIIQISRIKHLD